MESELKDVLEELDIQKNQNNLLHDEIARLEQGLEHKKVFALTTYYSWRLSRYQMSEILSSLYMLSDSMPDYPLTHVTVSCIILMSLQISCFHINRKQ